ncbi:hypothetical protein GobsT_20720 [Gemmata obscuriglobus]|nr:hypothetical protein GobsT_20720 [Gemmata obscuriglobus]VTS04151.1 Uncharacterized protein OS=Rhodopirellula sallentina SM41 GN=RSSM_01927 PE=4 SV=1 [Gemmata obscuriglobus UQM 2246]
MRDALARVTNSAVRVIDTSHVESTIRQMNHRVKGSEKFWSESGAEAILQLRADRLSETAPLDDSWDRRQARITGDRRYTLAVQSQLNKKNFARQNPGSNLLRRVANCCP